MAATNIAPADSIITNENSRWRRKLRRRLDAPGVVDGGAHRVEDAEGGVGQGQAAADADADPLGAEAVHLPGDELELLREVAEDEADDGVARLRIGGQPADHREQEQEEREQRQQGVEGNRGGVRETLAAVELAHAPPGGPQHEPHPG